jgi:hypothetical protein
MKTFKFLFGILALLVITAISANAQIVVTEGSTHNFKVTTDHSAAPFNYVYGWSTAPGGNTIATADKAATDIKFVVAGATTISVSETNPLGGCATINNFLVTVLGMQTLAFTSATSQSCANVAAVLPFTFGGATADYYPLVINYKVAINGAPAIDRIATLAFGATFELPLTAADRADLSNPAGPSYNIVVTLVSATANSGTVTLGAAVNTNTVFDIPDANVIIKVN